MAEQKGPSDDATGASTNEATVGQGREKKVPPPDQTPARATDSKYPRLKAAALAVSLAVGQAAGLAAESSYRPSHGPVDTSPEKIPVMPTKPRGFLEKIKAIAHRAIDASTNEDSLRQSYRELQQKQSEIEKLKGDKEYWSYFLSISITMFLIMNELIERKRRKELTTENQKLREENKVLKTENEGFVEVFLQTEGVATGNPSGDLVEIVTPEGSRFVTIDVAKKLAEIALTNSAELRRGEALVGLTGLRIATDEAPAGAAQPSAAAATAQAEDEAAAAAEPAKKARS